MIFVSANHAISVTSISTVLLSSVDLACAVECGNTAFDTVNATGSVQFPGFQFRQSEPTIKNNTWTISTAPTQSLLAATNTATIQQDFWLNTDPLVTSNLTNLPFWGCAFLLQRFEQEPLSTGTNDSTSCNGVFDNECYNAKTTAATSSAWKFNTNVASIVPVCEDIGQAISSPIPKQCKKSPWSSFLQAVPLGDVGSTSDSCNSKVFNGSANQATILSLGPDLSKSENFSDYDNWVRRASPLLMTVFKKTYTGDQSPRWADSRLVCLTAKNITPGSRIPTNGAVPEYERPTMALILVAVIWIVICTG